jgi:Tfp pilus assembly PilM family ATPase/Tfp pilus assembly protein PilN
MLHHFKSLLAPRTVAALATDSRTIRAVRMATSPKGIEVTGFVLKEVEDPENLQEELRSVFRSGKLHHEVLVSCLPSSRAALRQFPVAFDSTKTLEKIIKFQLEPHVPHPIEELLVDFLPAARGKEVVAAGVQKAEMSRHLQILSGAGLEPGIVGIDDLALFFLYHHIHQGGGRTVAMINLDDGKAGVQIVSDAGIEFIRILPLREAWEPQLSETFHLYSYDPRAKPLEEILLTGSAGDRPEEVRTAIESVTQVKTSFWRPMDHLDHRLGEIPEDIQGRLSVPLGLALGSLSPATRLFNLRKEEFKVHSAVEVRKSSFFFLVTLAVLAFFTFHLYFRLHIQERRYREVEKSVQQVFKRTLPEVTTVLKGRELAQMKQRIDAAKAEYQWLQNVNREGTTLDLLLALSRAISAFPDVAVENISIETPEIRLDGYASAFETVDKLEKRVNGSGSFRAVKLVGAKMDNRENLVRFQFSIERK